MPEPTVTILAPPPTTYADPDNLRPQAEVSWTGGVGPFDVLHEWDTDSNFGTPLQDLNAGATSPDTGTPPADLGPAGTQWFYRVTVTDTSDAASQTPASKTLNWIEAVDHPRFLHYFANPGVWFSPTDDPAVAGPADPDPVADGNTVDFNRYLYALGNVGTAFEPFDTQAPGPDDDNWPADGHAVEFSRYHYYTANVGVGFDPTDTPAEGWDPEDIGGPGPGDGFTVDFDRFLYVLANVTSDTPTPHIWYVFPNFGRDGWEFAVIGYGFGDTQGEYGGSVTLNGLAVSILTWELIAESSPDLTIDPVFDIAEPVHQRIAGIVPEDATSGLVVVCTDGP